MNCTLRLGMVKTFQLAHDGTYGSSTKIAPITTETDLNKETCLKINGSEDLRFTPQTIIPDTTGMEVRRMRVKIQTILEWLTFQI